MLLIMARFLSVFTGTPFPLNLVTAQSMNPTLMEGDVVAWTPTTIDEIEIGDVVVFKSYVNWPGEKLVIHRVSDIKTASSTGERLLETKGDANSWKDQAGPHIPEPYIREDHVMGKAISIGQTPLKIPFVGYLGVWVNDGLEALSQPTSSKGSLTYVGVFAPLTISIALFVILLFVLPEKAKTIKEKLKFLIFGPKAIKLRRIIISFLAAYIVFLTIIHCFAYDSTTTSYGIESSSTDSALNFGRIKQGTESFSKELPVVNMGTLPVKGVIFGRGNVSEHVTRKTFLLGSGESENIPLKAVASNNSRNGTFYGDIMVYSSPFWTIFPDEFMQNVCNWNAEITVFTLDFFSALYLTTITVVLLAIITFISDKYNIFSIDLSWQHAHRLIIKREIIEKIIFLKDKTKKALGRSVGWITKIDIGEINEKETPTQFFIKPIVASLAIVPIFFLASDQIISMIIASIIAGITAYFISCKVRRKIILTSIIAMSMAVAYMIIDTNLLILSMKDVTMEIMALSLGAMGIYLLVLGLFLIPLSLISWFITHIIRNVKEQKDPLLILEGKCNL